MALAIIIPKGLARKYLQVAVVESAKPTNVAGHGTNLEVSDLDSIYLHHPLISAMALYKQKQVARAVHYHVRPLAAGPPTYTLCMYCPWKALVLVAGIPPAAQNIYIFKPVYKPHDHRRPALPIYIISLARTDGEAAWQASAPSTETASKRSQDN